MMVLPINMTGYAFTGDDQFEQELTEMDVTQAGEWVELQPNDIIRDGDRAKYPDALVTIDPVYVGYRAGEVYIGAVKAVRWVPKKLTYVCSRPACRRVNEVGHKCYWCGV